MYLLGLGSGTGTGTGTGAGTKENNDIVCECVWMSESRLSSHSEGTESLDNNLPGTGAGTGSGAGTEEKSMAVCV